MRRVIQVSDKYATGEIQLIETEPGDGEQARQRLEQERAYHRQYAAKKKAGLPIEVKGNIKKWIWYKIANHEF